MAFLQHAVIARNANRARVVRPSVTFRFVQTNEDTIVRSSGRTIIQVSRGKLIRIFAGDHPQRNR